MVWKLPNVESAFWKGVVLQAQNWCEPYRKCWSAQNIQQQAKKIKCGLSEEHDLAYRRPTIHKVLSMFRIPFWSDQSIMKENVNKHQLAAKSVSSLLFDALCLHVNFWLCYTPNLVLCDFFLFQKIKMVLEERKFNNTTMICGKMQDSHAQVQTMHITKCFRQWCLLSKSHEDYFEEDTID